jgi:hypothetical protein
MVPHRGRAGIAARAHENMLAARTRRPTGSNGSGAFGFLAPTGTARASHRGRDTRAEALILSVH